MHPASRRRSRPAPAAAGLLVGALTAGLLVAGSPGAAAKARAADTGIDARIVDAVAKLDTLAADLMAKSGIPGMAVAVVHDGKTVYAKGFGVRKMGEPAAVDPDTVFQLASVSKSVGATVVGHEVSRRVVDWSTPVKDNLPSFRLGSRYVTNHVTVGDMYAHRSGLMEHAGDLAEIIGFNRKQVLKKLRYFPLDRFRDHYAYTNFGLTAGAESVARAAGKSWEQLSEDALYRPLGMASTSSRFADYENRKDRAVGHVRLHGKWVAKYVRQPDAQSPAGGVSSSVNDMAKWLTMLLAGGTYQGKTIVKPAVMRQMTTPQSVSRPAATYGGPFTANGFGFNVSTNQSGRMVLSHSGAFSAGAGTSYTAIPALDLGIVTLTNAAPTGVAEALNADFMDLAQYGAIQQDWWAMFSQIMAGIMAPEGSLAGKTPPADPKAARPAHSYTGKYANDVYGTIKVKKAKRGALTLVVGPARDKWRLTHWNGNVFAVRPAGQAANPGSLFKVKFGKARSGSARSMWLEYFDGGGLGTFRR